MLSALFVLFAVRVTICLFIFNFLRTSSSVGRGLRSVPRRLQSTGWFSWGPYPAVSSKMAGELDGCRHNVVVRNGKEGELRECTVAFRTSLRSRCLVRM